MPKNMLVADDSVVIQKAIGITFAQEDYAITYVNNGEDAVAKAKQIKPDVILADVTMPSKSGYEVCETVRKDPQLARTPILLMAGTHEPFDEARSRTSGADGYIIKPFESQTLIDRVKELMSGQRPAPAPPATAAPPSPPSRPTPAPPAAAAKPPAPPPR